MNGPHEMEARQAVAWARRHAERVRVRAGTTFYTAGREPVPGLPEWPEVPSEPSVAEPQRAEEPVAWSVEASTGWFRGDRLHVATRLAAEMRAEAAASAVAHALTATGFRVTFSVNAGSVVEAEEMASRILRTAWAATGADAMPGIDYDLSSIMVRSARGA